MRVRRRLSIVLAVVAVVALTGCSMWTQGRADGGRSGSNPFEATITADNVGNLHETSHILAPFPSPPVVNGNGILAFSGRAYDLSSCGPVTCHRTLTARAGSPAMVGDTLYALTVYGTRLTTSGIGAFDDHGPDSCRTRPDLCPPRWVAGLPPPFVPGHWAITDFVVDGDALVAHVRVDNLDIGRFDLYVASWDTTTNATCPADSSGLRICPPRWLDRVGTAEGEFDPVDELWRRVAATGGRVVSLREHTPVGAIQARDRDGQPVWTADGYFDGDPVVTPSRTFATLASGEVVAYDTGGGSGCSTVTSGAPRVCTPLWTATAPAPATGLAVTKDLLYVSAKDGGVYAFDAHGVAGCSGAPVVCAPLWSVTPVPGPVFAPTIAGDVLYLVSAAGVLKAYDATGTTGCTGAPKVCAPLKTLTLASDVPLGSAAVARGRVLVPTRDRIVILGATP